MRKSLDEIVPVPGVQEWLLENMITERDKEWVKRPDGSLDCYHDGTYDWYAGFSAFAPQGSILEIGVYRGYSVAAMLKGQDRELAFLIDSGKEGVSIRTTRDDLVAKFPSTVFVSFDFDTQSEPIPFSETLFSIVHIDAFHSYHGLINDLFNFAPLVSKDGLVIVHDTADPPLRSACMDFMNDDGGWEFREIPTVNGNIVMRRTG